MATKPKKHHNSVRANKFTVQCFLKCLKYDEGVKHFLCLFVCTAVFLPMICMFLRESIFYVKPKNLDKERQLMKATSEQRFNESLVHIEQFNLQRYQLGKPHQTESNIEIGITIITVSRNRHYFDSYEPKYLTQVVGRLLYLLNDSTLTKTYKIFICNVDGDPASYKESASLSKILPTFQRFHSKMPQTTNVFEKEKKDYLYCLNKTLQQGVKYALLVEDDAYAEGSLFHVLENVVDRRVEDRYSEVKLLRPREVTYVKFYHPPRLLGYYSFEIERIPELLAIGLVFGTALTCIYYKIQIRSRVNENKMWFLFCVYFCLVAIAIGRQNLLEFRRLSRYLFEVTPAPSCCTPAMLFPREGGETIISYMETVTCSFKYGKDMLLEDMKIKHSLVGLMVQPNLFKHIGLYSSLRSEVLDPFIV